MTVFLLAFTSIQVVGLAVVLVAVRRAPVGIETEDGFQVVREARDGHVAVEA